jgi:hypothetical protein
MATAADIVTSARAATDQVYADGGGPIFDSQILGWANEEYPMVRRMIALQVPDLFATVSAALAVAQGASEIDVSSLTGLDLIFEVTRETSSASGRYRRVSPAPVDPESATELVWRRRGMSGAGAVVELYPATYAPGTYKVRYLATATALSGSGVVNLPAGGERVLVESVCARILDKLHRDYSARLRARDTVLRELLAQWMPRDYSIVRTR